MSEAREMLHELIKDSTDAVKNGALWVQGEIPLLVREILMYNGIVTGLGVLLGIAFTIVPLVVCYRLALKHRRGLTEYEPALKMYRNREDPRGLYHNLDYIGGIPSYPDVADEIPYYISCAVVSLFGSVVLIINLVVFLKITLAPRVYLLEYASGLL